MLEQRENFMKNALRNEFPKQYDIFTNNLRIEKGRMYKRFFNNTPIIIALAINEQLLMLRFLFDHNYTDATEKTRDCEYNLTHICLIHNVSPRMFLLCHEHNMYNIYTYSLTNIHPFDLLTDNYATQLLAERCWRKHHIIFLIGKKSDNKIARYVIQIRELHRMIAEFI